MSVKAYLIMQKRIQVLVGFFSVKTLKKPNCAKQNSGDEAKQVAALSASCKENLHKPGTDCRILRLLLRGALFCGRALFQKFTITIDNWPTVVC